MKRVAEIQLLKSQARNTAVHQFGRALIGDKARVSDMCVLREVFLLADKEKAELKFFIYDDDGHKVYLEVDKVRDKTMTHFNGHEDKKNNE